MIGRSPQPPHRYAQRTRKSKASQTPGKTKGGNCVSDPIKKFYACNPKARHRKDYEVWNNKFRQINKQ